MRREGCRSTLNGRGAEINGSLAPSLQARGNSSRGAGYRSSTSRRPSFHLCSLALSSNIRSLPLPPPPSPPLPLSLTLPSQPERLGPKTGRSFSAPIHAHTRTYTWRGESRAQARNNGRCDYRESARATRRNVIPVFTRVPVRVARASLTTGHARMHARAWYARNRLYGHVRKSIRRAATNLEQLVVSNA